VIARRFGWQTKPEVKRMQFRFFGDLNVARTARFAWRIGAARTILSVSRREIKGNSLPSTRMRRKFSRRRRTAKYGRLVFLSN